MWNFEASDFQIRGDIFHFGRHLQFLGICNYDKVMWKPILRKCSSDRAGYIKQKMWKT